MSKLSWARLALTSGSLLLAARAEAHFRLVEPASWLTEDELGGPQKGAPCGPGNAMLIVGDDVQPVPWSRDVTTFSAGQKVTFQLEETIYHPGYFRVSLARTTAARATTADFPNPPLTDPVNCHYAADKVPSGAHDNVLADGLFMIEGQEGTNRSLMPSVTLPDEPCEDCTLQVMQVMEGHPGSSCFYYHCADIKIVAAKPAGPSDAGSAPDAGRPRDAGSPSDAARAPDDSGARGVDSGRTSDQSKTADAGTGPGADAGPRATAGGPADSGGCTVRAAATISSPGLVCWLLAVAAIGFGRRRSVRMFRRKTP